MFSCLRDETRHPVIDPVSENERKRKDLAFNVRFVIFFIVAAAIFLSPLLWVDFSGSQGAAKPGGRCKCGNEKQETTIDRATDYWPLLPLWLDMVM